jgi:hypothetical protein
VEREDTADPSSKDNAYLSDPVGGIDLDPAMLGLELKGKEIQFNINIPPAVIERIKTKGIQPVIFQITPVTNLPFLLGIQEEDDIEQLSRN